MNNLFYKFLKGLTLIIVAQFFIASSAFVIQSCQRSELFNSQREISAKNNFLNSIPNDIENLNQIQITQLSDLSTTKKIYTKTTQDEMAIISLYLLPDVPRSSILNLDTVSNFSQVMNIDGTEVSVMYSDGSMSDNISDTQELITSYEIPVQSAQQSLQPTLAAAKNYLRSKGLTDSDIQGLLTEDSDGPAMSESDLIPAVMMLIAEEERASSLAHVDFSKFFITSAYASQIGECAGDALGISAIAAVVSQGVNTAVGKALMKKAIRKVAVRALGWVGAAIFAYEFGDCMGWW